MHILIDSQKQKKLRKKESEEKIAEYVDIKVDRLTDRKKDIQR
jgi:hypothetical protein